MGGGGPGAWVGASPAAVVSLTHSAPFGFRKMSQTLARALELDADIGCYDIAGHPGSLLDGLELASALADGGARRGTRHRVRSCGELRRQGVRHVVGRRRGGVPRRRVRRVRDARAGRCATAVRSTTSGGLGQEPEPRYRLEVLFDAYGQSARGRPREVGAADGTTDRRSTRRCARASHIRRPCGRLGRAGVTEAQLARRASSAEIGNLGCCFRWCCAWRWGWTRPGRGRRSRRSATVQVRASPRPSRSTLRRRSPGGRADRR